MKLLLKLFVFLSVALPAMAQTTWICPASSALALTNVLSTNQVMEIWSASYDSNTALDVIIGDQTVSLGAGSGGATVPSPLIMAGPATIIFRKTSTGGAGCMFTYKITDKDKAESVRPGVLQRIFK